MVKTFNRGFGNDISEAPVNKYYFYEVQTISSYSLYNIIFLLF